LVKPLISLPIILIIMYKALLLYSSPNNIPYFTLLKFKKDNKNMYALVGMMM